MRYARHVLPFAVSYTTPCLAFAGLSCGGYFLWAAPVMALVVIPLLDFSIHRLPLAETRGISKVDGAVFDVLTLGWVPCQLMLLLMGLYVSVSSNSWGLLLAAACNVGLLTGSMGITVAHELMHRSTRLHRAAAELLMLSVTYTHFCIEHVLGHHVQVATDSDAASARKNESFFAFLPRTLTWTLRSAWQLETARAQAKKESGSLRDRRVRYAVCTAIIYSALYGFFGTRGVLFWLVQSVVAVILLETINYVEHYGLSRKMRENGRVEVVRPEHSWNSSHPVTGIFLFHLPRHSDHHAHASRAYYQLEDIADAPQLPTGYAAMLWLAWIPPLFMRAMNPRVDMLRRNGASSPASSEV